MAKILLRSLSVDFELIKREITLGEPGPLNLSRGQRQTMTDRFQIAADIFLLALEEETALFWGGPCGRECQAASRD